MIEISLGDVPLYLRGGDYYKTLSDNDGDGTFSVPAGVLKADPSVASIGEARHLLCSLQFWIIDIDESIISNLVECFLSSTDRDEATELTKDFGVAFPFLHVIGVILSESTDIFDGHTRQSQSWSAASIVHLIALVEAGHLIYMNWYPPKHDFRGVKDLHYAAVRSGHLDCLKYLANHRLPLGEDTSCIAANRGHLHILEYLHTIRGPFDIYCCRHAAQNGHLTCLKFLHSIGRPWGVHVPSHAARNGHLDCLMFARVNGCAWDEETCRLAATGGHLDCLKYARENGCRWTSYICEVAARNGHVACLQYAHLNGCNIQNTLSSIVAAENGNLDCLVYACENGCPMNSYTFAFAAGGGHLACLQYLHQRDCPMSANACSAAAFRGHLECLQYSHSIGCPWDSATCYNAAEKGHLACLQYACENGCAWSGVLSHEHNETCIAVHAFTARRDECGFYLIRQCTGLSSDITKYAAEMGRLDILEACVSARIPWHVDTCDVAEARGHKKCMEFALARGAPTTNKTFRNVYRNLEWYYRKKGRDVTL